VSFAGDRTLAQEVREPGRLQPEWLQTWGGDVLATLDQLERAGVAHRDIEPDNLGVAERKVKGRKGLVLFDFSLARAPREDTEAGTPPCLDPFIGAPQRRVWGPGSRAARRRGHVVRDGDRAPAGLRDLWGASRLRRR
jgi:serine/threonine protein kinase